MKKLEMKDLTEAEKAEIALLVQKAQANADHTPDQRGAQQNPRSRTPEDRRRSRPGRQAASALAREKAKGASQRPKCCLTPSTGPIPSATNTVADGNGSMNARR